MISPTVEIDGRKIGAGHPCFIVGEVGQAHEGSLGMAHSYIDAIADAGADAVKFQTHIAEAEGTVEEKFRVRVFPQDETRRDYWRRTAFTEKQWRRLKEHADERELVFLSSPFSVEAVELLQRIGVKGWKIGSGETNNLPMLKRIVQSRLPVLLSTGMSYWAEIDESVRLLEEGGAPFVLYQCSSSYPTPPEKIGLNVIARMKERYGAPVGLSDHSGRACVGIAAHALGADSIENHVTFHKKSFGPDVPASLTVDEFGEMVRSIRFMEKVYAHPVDKDAEAKGLEGMRSLFTKSVVPRSTIRKGARLSEENLTAKKPGGGIPAADLEKLVGKRAARDLEADEIFSWEDLVDE